MVTEGGFRNNGIWVDVNYFPFKMLRRSLAVSIAY